MQPLAADLLPLIRQCLAKQSWLPPIPAALRARYNAAQHAQNSSHNRRTFLILTCMFDLFLIPEMKTAPDIIGLSAILRLAVFTPLMLAFIFLDQRQKLRQLYSPSIALLGALPTIISAILVLLASHADVDGASDVRGIPLILLTTGLIARLTPAEVLCNAILSVCGFTIALVHTSIFTRPEINSLIFSDISVGICAIIFNWQMESRDRRLFLLQTSDAINTATLAAHARGLLAQTQTDGLTGVANRRHFDATLAGIWQDAIKTSTPLSLVLIDIDHFKLFNDHYGHQGGDDCLRRVATQLRREARASDLFARYGGEEFAAILPATGLDAAAQIAERMRAAIAALNLPHAGMGEGVCVSISLGAASLTPAPGDDPRHLVELADTNLYAAKRAGRNRVHPHLTAPAEAVRFGT